MDDSRETKPVVGVRRLKEAMAKPASLRIITVANQKGGLVKPPPRLIWQRLYLWGVYERS